MTLIHLVTMTLVQEFLEVSVIGFQLQTCKIALAIQQNTLIPCVLQRVVEIGGVTDILVGIDTEVSVCLVECAGAFTEPRTDLAFLIEEIAEPVVLSTVVINGFPDAGRYRYLVFQIDDLFRTFDDPGENAFTGVLIKVITIVFDIAFAFNSGIERNDDQPAPCAVIGGTDLRQMIGIQHQAVAGGKN